MKPPCVKVPGRGPGDCRKCHGTGAFSVTALVDGKTTKAAVPCPVCRGSGKATPSGK